MTAREDRPPRDTSTPTLLVVSLGGVLGAVVGIVVLGQVSTTAALVAAFVVLLAGTIVVTLTVGRQLDDGDGTGAPHPEQRVESGDRPRSREADRRVHSAV